MNILPHKSWHVYNKKNIEKVRKDEAKAKEQQDTIDKRALIADSEARLQLLRQRAAKNQLHGQDEHQLVKKDLVSGHIHLFAEAEKAASQNEEVVAEKKAEKDKLDKQFTMYLDKGSKDEEAPWYAKNELTKYSDDHLTKPYIKSKHDKDGQKRYRRSPITLESDPLAIIRSQLDKEEKESRQSDHYHHRHHHELKSSKSKSSKSSKRQSRQKTKTPSIEELRAQRREREKAERLRTHSVIYGDTQNTQHDSRHHQYNSQYNRQETSDAHQSQRSKRRRYD
ncbi:hypothetical protein BCR42DRAFT_441214 [Absidia repens]|uniref:CBF1-interacting co-repressor CIR N-terminal domain-containing protein n=1 Tax=Absidia repens TaxID=90262 RepID=A0A1X2I5V0_9FUNG|nr:hypothetical protein BCR42DRAFT_441214 [Absidia repens]